MKLHQLRDFVAVVQRGSVRAASRALGIAQPSITKSIRQLEAEHQVALFERSSKGLSLTHYGEAFSTRVSSVMNELTRAQNELRQLSTGSGGTVNVAMGGISLLNLLPGAFATFRRRYPRVAVRVMERPYDQAVYDMRQGELDFAVVPEPAEDISSELTLRPLMQDRYAVICRKGHPLGNTTQLDALLDAEWLVTRQRGSKAGEFERFFERQGLRPPAVAIQCESIVGVLSLIAATDLLALTPARWLQTDTVRHISQELPLGLLMAATPTCILRRTAFPLTPAAEAFAAALEVEANALPAT